MHRRALVASAILSLLAATACEEKKPAPPPKPVEKPTPPPAKPEDKASAASVPGKSDPECVGPVELGVPEKFKIGAKEATRNGYKLTLEPADADGEARLGVLANVKEDTGENLFNLERYLAWFKEQKAEAILVAGDSAETASGVERVLATIGKSGLPVLVIAGNRESKGEYLDGVAAARKTAPNIIDMNKVRFADLGTATVLSLPGYHDPRFLHSESGCQYHKDDVDGLAKLAAEAKSPVVLMSHSPPRGETKDAIDYATGAGNVGDPNINGALAKIPFGVMANIHEAGGRAQSDAVGKGLVKENTPSDVLYLNPGPADSVRWTLNDGSESRGMAAMLVVKGKQASYTLLRAKALTEKEQADAKKLEPKADASKADPQKGDPKK